MQIADCRLQIAQVAGIQGRNSVLRVAGFSFNTGIFCPSFSLSKKITNMSSRSKLDDDLVQSRTQGILRFKGAYEDIFARYERDFLENDEIESTDDENDNVTDEIGTEDEEDPVESAAELELKTILPLVCTLLSDIQNTC